MLKLKSFSYALVLTLFCSFLGKYLSSINTFKLIGHLVLALLLGMALQLFKLDSSKYHDGVAFISNKFLRLGIILLGFKLNIDMLLNNGIKTLVLAVFVVCFTIFIIYNISKIFKVEEKLSLLSACGCGICGAAAVMGISHANKSSKDDTILSIAVVCVLGTIFTLLIVFLKPYLGLTEVQYGVLSGGSLHEIAHAVAAGSNGGSKALEIAIITKLSRVLILAPVAIIIGYLENKKKGTHSKEKAPIPYFMFGFILTSVIGTYSHIKAEHLDLLVNLAYIFLGMSMAALGLNVNFKIIKERGKNVFLSCFIGSAILFVTVLLISKFMF